MEEFRDRKRQNGRRIQECKTVSSTRNSCHEEIKNLKMGSSSAVCSEASTRIGLGSGTFAGAQPLSSKWTEDVDSKKTGIQGVESRFHKKKHSKDYEQSSKNSSGRCGEVPRKMSESGTRSVAQKNFVEHVVQV